MNIELYIGDRLCDIGNPENLGIYLKRVFIKPSELSTKDAQKSYEISLPATPTNNEIFHYTNVEEVQGKFRVYDNARLYIDGFLILDGKFRISQITADAYVGNLGVPAAKTVKDIFGETKLTEIAPYKIDFKGFAESVSNWNKGIYEKSTYGNIRPCIFPYVLYGLLPKTPIGKDSNAFTDRDIWDNSVSIRMQDVPPSLNVLEIIRHIFKSKKYTLSGTAFEDPQLNSLYMSYKNESDYVQSWNYGKQGSIKLSGSWSNVNDSLNAFEKNCTVTDMDGCTYYTCNLFDASRSSITINENTGANVSLTKYEDSKGFLRTHCQVRIPMSGVYKIRLKADMKVLPIVESRKGHWRDTDSSTGINFVAGNTDADSIANSFAKNRYEIKILRDWNTEDFGLSNNKLNRTYYRNNLSQRLNENSTPRYYPKPIRSKNNRESELMFVDPSENPNYVLGLAWGKPWHKEPGGGTNEGDNNPLIADHDNTSYGTVLAGKSGLSWNTAVNGKLSKLAISSPGYMKYGVIGDFANASDEYITHFDDAWITLNNELETNGILKSISQPSVNKTIAVSRYELEANRTCIIAIPGSPFLWEGTIYVYDTSDLTKPCVEKYNSSDFWTGNGYEFSINTTSTKRFVSFMIYDGAISDTASYDISNQVRLTYLPPENTIIGWEPTSKFKQEIRNAPENYARRGWYDGKSLDGLWHGDGSANAAVWLNAGELITIALTSDNGRYARQGPYEYWGWVTQSAKFELDISPFRTDEDWIKVDNSGNGTGIMDWNDSSNFESDTIDLIKFLPNDVRVDEFIDNFCKAFNLKLSQTGTKDFTLDTKQVKRIQQNSIIDIDKSASVKDRSNEPLNLPSTYSLGFTIDEEEEGFVKTKENGGGIFATGSDEGNSIEQKSNFSYNWFKNIQKQEADRTVTIPLPVISKAEAWTTEMTYPEAMKKKYTNLGLRFWYFDGLLNDLGASFYFGQNNTGNSLYLAKVTNSLPGLNTLSYKNESNTILTNYFTLFANANTDYTIVECYLQPDQYVEIGKGAKVKFNGDIYHVAEIDGYDPLNRKKCKLKLIRDIV